MKKIITLVTAAGAALSLSSCQPANHAQANAGTGALLGAGLGAIIGNQSGNTAQGAAIGGARRTYKHTGENAPLGNATLEAVGGTAVYLASDVGSHTSGEVIRVDGGFHVLGMPQPDHL